MATPLDPDKLVVESFPTQDEPNFMSQPAVSEPPMICSCFGSCDIYCGDTMMMAAAAY